MLRFLLLVVLIGHGYAETAAEAPPAPPSPRCSSFCDRALGTCKGDDAAYDNLDDCLTSCGKFPNVTMDIATGGNIVGGDTLECREFYLTRAEKALKLYGGVPAGMCDYTAVGGGMCDNSVSHSCEGYCSQLTGEGDCGPGPWHYSDMEACLAVCKDFAPGVTDSMRGNSLACRILYINIGEQSVYGGGGELAKKEFCPHAAGTSVMCSDNTPPQSTQCTDYCEWSAKFCHGHGIANETNEQCLSYCQALDANERACHLKYVAVAARSTVPEVPCHHREVCPSATGKPRSTFESVPLPAQLKQPLPIRDVEEGGGADVDVEGGPIDPNDPTHPNVPDPDL